MSNELKPCPFCGGEPDTDQSYAVGVYYGCYACDVWRLGAEQWNTRAQLSAQSVSAVQPVAWATHHDEPMLFPTFKEAAMYCDDGEEPIALVPITHPADADAVDAKEKP